MRTSALPKCRERTKSLRLLSWSFVMTIFLLHGTYPYNIVPVRVELSSYVGLVLDLFDKKDTGRRSSLRRHLAYLSSITVSFNSHFYLVTTILYSVYE
jgi:hypothetical protein